MENKILRCNNWQQFLPFALLPACKNNNQNEKPKGIVSPFTYLDRLLGPLIFMYILSYLSRKDLIISGVDLLQSAMDNVRYIYQNQEIMSFFVSTVKHL